MSASSTESSPAAQAPERNTALASRESSSASHDGSDAATTPRRSVTEDAEAHLGTLLQAEGPPPLPNEAPPRPLQDDGWDPVWDENAQTFYFYNRFTKRSQWENPRIPTLTEPAPPGVGNYDRIERCLSNDPPPTDVKPAAGSYDPAIHGDYDPDADYAKAQPETGDSDFAGLLHPPGTITSTDPYAATGTFNRFTGKWQAATLNPENFNDENKSRRQMNAYFDVDAAANSHDGKSLKAERSGKKLSKKELKAFKDKRRERKEEKRRAWLRD